RAIVQRLRLALRAQSRARQRLASAVRQWRGDLRGDGKALSRRIVSVVASTVRTILAAIDLSVATERVGLARVQARGEHRHLTTYRGLLNRLLALDGESANLIKAAVLPTRAEEKRIAEDALDHLAARGFSDRRANRAVNWAMRGWRTLIPRVVGFEDGFTVVGTQQYTFASGPIGADHEMSAADVVSIGVHAGQVSVAATLALAMFGDRLITNMRVIAILGLVDAGGLFLLGLGSHAPLWLALGMIGVGRTVFGQLRGRKDVYHPAVGSEKLRQEAQMQTVSRSLQLIGPSAYVLGFGFATVQATTWTAAVIGLSMLAVTVALLRHGDPTAHSRDPPSLKETLSGAIYQLLGTPHGLRRLVYSAPSFAVLAGVYFYLGGGVLSEIVGLNAPGAAAAVVAVLVTIATVTARLPSILAIARWPSIKEMLGSRHGVRNRLRGARLGPVSEARVLRSIARSATALLVPALWLGLRPGVEPLVALLTVGSMVQFLGQTSVIVWKEGGAGASLVAASRTVGVIVGATIGLALVHAQGSQVADLRIAGTVPVVVAAGIALAWGIGRYRGATLGPLRSALSRVISAAPAEDVITLADPDAIIKKLRKRGVSDFYSAYDLFRPEDHTPRWATWLPSWWVRALGSARSARQGQLGLTPAETRALGLALDEVASHGDIPRRRSPRPGAVVSTGGGTPMRSPVPALAVVGGVVLGMSGHPLLGAVAVLLGGLAWVGPALVRTAARGGYALARFLRRANAPPSRMITVVADVLAARGRRQVVPDLIINKRAIAQVADADGGLDIDASGRVQGEEGAGGLIKNFRGIVNLERHGITWLAAATNDPERRAAERAGGEPFLLHVPRSAETYRLLLGVSDRHDFQLFNEVAADSRLWLELHGMGRRLGPVTPTERDAFEAFFRVNGHIAAAALRYLDGRTAPLVMIRDYHFTDVPRLIRVARPDVTLHQFIHDSFAAPEHWLRSDGIGPELVDRLIGGLLGNDIVGFHTPTDVDNFLNTARALGYAIDLEARTVSVEDGREVWVRHYPG
ncbi:MAG: trehalose-6-phosphate synthase, partial [Sciscionella sp.]